MITVDDVLKSDDAHRETVEVPEWGGSLTVVSMTAAERADIEKRWSDKPASSDPLGFRVDILTRTLKNGDSKPWATEEQIREILATRNAATVERVFEAACRVSGFGKSDVEELEKN